MDTGLVSTAQVAARLDVHPSTVSRWVEAGRITPAVRLGGGRGGAMFFAPAAVDRLAASVLEPTG